MLDLAKMGLCYAKRISRLAHYRRLSYLLRVIERGGTREGESPNVR